SARSSRVLACPRSPNRRKLWRLSPALTTAGTPESSYPSTPGKIGPPLRRRAIRFVRSSSLTLRPASACQRVPARSPRVPGRSAVRDVALIGVREDVLDDVLDGGSGLASGASMAHASRGPCTYREPRWALADPASAASHRRAHGTPPGKGVTLRGGRRVTERRWLRDVSPSGGSRGGGTIDMLRHADGVVISHRATSWPGERDRVRRRRCAARAAPRRAARGSDTPSSVPGRGEPDPWYRLPCPRSEAPRSSAWVPSSRSAK